MNGCSPVVNNWRNLIKSVIFSVHQTNRLKFGANPCKTSSMPLWCPYSLPLPPKRSFILHGRFLYKWQLLLYAISLLHSAFFLFCLVFTVQKLRNNEMLMHALLSNICTTGAFFCDRLLMQPVTLHVHYRPTPPRSAEKQLSSNAGFTLEMHAPCMQAARRTHAACCSLLHPAYRRTHAAYGRNTSEMQAAFGKIRSAF